MVILSYFGGNTSGNWQSALFHATKLVLSTNEVNPLPSPYKLEAWKSQRKLLQLGSILTKQRLSQNP